MIEPAADPSPPAIRHAEHVDVQGHHGAPISLPVLFAVRPDQVTRTAGAFDNVLQVVQTRSMPTLSAAHSEIFATFSKIHPFLAEIPQATGEPEFCKHLEVVVLGTPDAGGILARRREAARAAAKARRSDRTMSNRGDTST